MADVYACTMLLDGYQIEEGSCRKEISWDKRIFDGQSLIFLLAICGRGTVRISVTMARRRVA